jgi:hypothetical protein
MVCKVATSTRGFTLIELIMFIVIGAIFLPASFVAFTAAIQHFSTPDYYVKARFFAEQKMEELTSNVYIAPSLSPVAGATESINDPSGAVFQRSWSICYVGPGDIDAAACLVSPPDTNYKRITVTITPPSGPDYIVKTLVTKRPKS